MPEHITTKIVTARKDHRCSVCGAVAVHGGQRYERSVFVHDGRAYTWITCEECAAMTRDVWDASDWPEEGISADDYAEWARDNPDDERAVAYLAREREAQP